MPTAVVIAAVDSASIVIPAAIVVLLALAAFWLWTLVDVLSWPAPAWDAAGLDKSRWVLRVVILGCIGAGLYRASARPGLKRAYAEIRSARRA